jgi:hypothetical protein
MNLQKARFAVHPKNVSTVFPQQRLFLIREFDLSDLLRLQPDQQHFHTYRWHNYYCAET